MAEQNLQTRAAKKVKTEAAWSWYKLDEQKEGFWDSDARPMILAKEILASGLPQLFAIKKITRTGTYAMKSHDVEHAQKNLDKNKKNFLDEVLICQKIYVSGTTKPYNKIGWILDYETPLPSNGDDQGLDGIDMLSYNEETKTLTLLEAKKPFGTESLLRAVLEVFTYWKIIDHEKLLYDFSQSQRAADLHLSKHLRDNLYDIQVKKAVLLFNTSAAYKEYKDGYNSDLEKCSPVVQLMRTLGVGFYGIKECDGDYEVFDPLEE